MKKNLDNSRPKFTSSNELRNSIALACKDLYYLSEIDAPFVPLKEIRGVAQYGPPEIIQALALPPGAKVEEVGFAEFFAPLVEHNPGESETKKETSERFLALKLLFDRELTEKRVYKLGTVRLTVVVIGRASDGHLVGVTTEAVET